MILGHSELLRLVKNKKLVEGLADRELNDPEGCIFDLQLESVSKLKGKAFLGIEERETPELEELARFNADKITSFIFEPGKYYMVKTREKINLPKGVAAIFKPRATTFRCGLVLRSGFANPGFSGPLYFGIKNEGDIPVEVELGARFVSVIFLEVKGKAVHTYRGQWQGGRGSTEGREKQI